MMQQYLQIKERLSGRHLVLSPRRFLRNVFRRRPCGVKSSRHHANLAQQERRRRGAVMWHTVSLGATLYSKTPEAGHKVAVCEQVEDPALAKGVVKREVVRVITPGTVTADEALDGRGNNFLAAVCQGEAQLTVSRSAISPLASFVVPRLPTKRRFSTSSAASSPAKSCWQRATADCASASTRNIRRSI